MTRDIDHTVTISHINRRLDVLTDQPATIPVRALDPTTGEEKNYLLKVTASGKLILL